MEVGPHPGAASPWGLPHPYIMLLPQTQELTGHRGQLQKAELWAGDMSVMVKVSGQQDVQGEWGRPTTLPSGGGLLPKCGIHSLADLTPKPRATR